MSDERTSRIRRMEETMNRMRRLADRFDALLDEADALDADTRALIDYYGSPQWHDDMAASDAGALPDDLKCGVLTQDLPDEAVAGWRTTGIRMLEQGVRIVKSL
ncbi:DUF4298 domain-containing protein [Actinomyces sp. B33]|uniref:DUF4298 domain-containing protein n=1 Tax=Actinomyces sp. B33 TaxID=2942131 RepID=UPI002342571E|nr:DUF4298 domain-containing protein [Actinomyces sp. B33]MDC4232326.1 DUF4298 domain-containing protein [Actinomyces sp. B33]